jgi:MFS family permease
MMPLVVPGEVLQQANALQQTASAAAGIAGPVLAGILVVTVGPGWALIGDAASFVVSVVLFALLRLERIPRPEPHTFVADLRDGWSDFWSRHWFRAVVIGASAFNLIYAAYTVLGPVSSDRHYHGAATWAAVATAAAVGSVVAGLIATRLRPRRPLRTAVPFVALAALAPVAFAVHAPVAVLVAAAAVGGAGLIIFDSLWETSVQRHIPGPPIAGQLP